jgi:hypothetical protein
MRQRDRHLHRKWHMPKCQILTKLFGESAIANRSRRRMENFWVAIWKVWKFVSHTEGRIYDQSVPENGAEEDFWA